jgi:hypothetical protein
MSYLHTSWNKWVLAGRYSLDSFMLLMLLDTCDQGGLVSLSVEYL